jgi:hypothetical protein
VLQSQRRKNLTQRRKGSEEDVSNAGDTQVPDWWLLVPKADRIKCQSVLVLTFASLREIFSSCKRDWDSVTGGNGL